MTTPIKTQCPHCQTCFSLQQFQLNKIDAIVTCSQCQKSFSVNQNLTVTSDNASSPTTAHRDTQSKLNNQSAGSAHPTRNLTTSTKPSHNKKRTANTLIHDDLIYDDMEIDEPENSTVECDSLDSMDAWLSQASNTHSTAPAADCTKNTVSKNHQKEPSIDSSDARTRISPSSIGQEVLSSAAANDIHASINHTADN